MSTTVTAPTPWSDGCPDATGLGVVCDYPGKGRGLKAAGRILAGQVIAENPTILMNAEDCERAEATALGNYYFGHPENPDDGLFVLGAISLVNHADRPNARVDWRRDAAGWTAILRAIKDIAPGEEITHRYRCPPWFGVVQ